MLLFLVILSLATLPHYYGANHVTEELTGLADGKKSAKTDYPIVVLVNIGNLSCSGIAVNESWVLTLTDCANGSSKEPVWVSDRTGSNENKTQSSKGEERRAAKLRIGPTGSRLLLLQLERPLQRWNGENIPTFIKSNLGGNLMEPCKVYSLDNSSGSLHVIEVRLLRDADCLGTVASTNKNWLENIDTTKKQSFAFNGTVTEKLKRSRRNVESLTNSTGGRVSGETEKNTTNRNESKQPALDHSVLCSATPTNGVFLMGSPVVCHGVVVALATGKPLVRPDQPEDKKLQSYYALLQSQDEWIQKAVPWFHVSPAVGTAGNEYITEEECKLKSLLRLRRLSQIIFPWCSLLMDPSSESTSSKRYALHLDHRTASPNSFYRAFSWWLPIERTVRANMGQDDWDDQPKTELRREQPEPQESLRISNYVKKSATRQPSPNITTYTEEREQTIVGTTTLRPLKRVKRKAVKPEFTNASRKTAVLPISILRRLRNSGQRNSHSIVSLRKSGGMPSWRKVKYPLEFKK